MWSLPDINRMNSEAYAQKKKLERAARSGFLDRKKLKCEWDNHTTLCEHHDGYYGSPSEGYFECSDCQRVFTENYTWELYYHCDDGGMLCLPCYAGRSLADDSNWILLTDEGIDAVTEKTIRKAKHLIAVEMPVSKGIRFVGNTEFDSMDGHCISGGGLDELKETLRTLQAEGEDRAVLVLDAAYQFSISIGVYAETPEARDERRAESKTAVTA